MKRILVEISLKDRTNNKNGNLHSSFSSGKNDFFFNVVQQRFSTTEDLQSFVLSISQSYCFILVLFYNKKRESRALYKRDANKGIH
jgi:hypothetical protein